MADRVSESWGTPGSYTFDIPAYAKDITYIIRGGKGGTTSGTFRLDDRVTMSQTTPTPGSMGQYISGDLEDTVAGNSITIIIGDNGVYNATAYGYDAGSPGGSGYHSGGTGGYAPNSGSNEVWHTNGGGAGGGGSSAVYFSSNNVVLLEAGGGGGAGGAGYDFFSHNFPSYVSTITEATTYSGGSNGGTGGYGSTSTNSGSGGGGGGRPGGQGGRRNQSGNHIPGIAGAGGGGYCNTSYATATVSPTEPPFREDGYFYIEYDPQEPPTVTLTTSSTTLISGECVTLTWETTGEDITENTLTNYTDPGTSGSDEFCPTVSYVYTYTATNAAGGAIASVSITVYDPPIITLDSDDTSIIVGTGGTNISWTTTGDGDTIYWTSGLSLAPNNNINDDTDVNPTSTTTYTAYVTGLGGTSASSSVTVTVYYPPTISKFEVPVSVDWGSPASLIEYEFQYGNTDAKIEVTYNHKDINGSNVSVSKPDIVLTPSASAELDAAGSIRAAQFLWAPLYDDYGPRSVDLKLVVTGSGGTIETYETVTVVIDEVPLNLDVQDSPDKIAEQIVYTVDTPPDEVVMGNLYKVEDIDIPVEIKSDYPIQIRINNTGTWNEIREL